MRLLNSSCYLLLVAILLVLVEACKPKVDKASAKSPIYTYADYQVDSVWGYRDISTIRNEIFASCSHCLSDQESHKDCLLGREMEAQQGNKFPKVPC